jgi:tetratricopeptide (TPR) repeat protein
VKTILATFLILLLLIPVSTFGEIQTITHTVKQPFGGSQSPDDARISAVAKAKREALEMAGIYIESLTVVKNSQVDKDEILSLAAGVLKAEVVSQENYHTKDAFGIDVVVRVVVDTSVLESRVKKLLQDRTHLDQLNQARKKEKELLNEVARLEEENQRLMAGKESSKDLNKHFQEASQGLTAFEWFYKAYSLWDDGKITEPQKAIEYLNKGIRLIPDYAWAYSTRGIAYHSLGQHQRAIEDYNEAIRLNPVDVDAYYNRGIAYGNLRQYQQAVEDFDKAIRLKPDYAMPYGNRGSIHIVLGQWQSTIEDYNQAIRLNPDDAEAYYSRGTAHVVLIQDQLAIKDFDEAIRLQPDYASAYYYRGLAYFSLGQSQRAIEDYNRAIRLKPDYAWAYSTRGTAYIFSNNIREGCHDVQKACELGDCKAYEFAKGKGHCR